MTILHLREQDHNLNRFTIVRKRPMDRPPMVETKVRTAEHPRGVNIFSLARVICKRAQDEQPLNQIAA